MGIATAPASSCDGRMAKTSETRGLLMGALGILGFSLTLPMTRIAVAEFDPVIVGMGRALISATLAAFMLWHRKSPLPGWRNVPSLLTVVAGVIIGYPLTSLAMQRVPSAHGAIVAGLIPLATALFALLRAHERPSRGFWIAAVAGSAAVVLFALAQGGWALHRADILLLVAVVLCGLGYAEGGRLAREIGGLELVGWALLLAVPIVAFPVARVIAVHGLHASARAWAALAYTGVVSMFLAFWAWYHGLALGGIARVGQIQLLQVFLTLGWAAFLLGEKITVWTALTAIFVVGTVAIGRRTAIVRA